MLPMFIRASKFPVISSYRNGALNEAGSRLVPTLSRRRAPASLWRTEATAAFSTPSQSVWATPDERKSCSVSNSENGIGGVELRDREAVQAGVVPATRRPLPASARRSPSIPDASRR